MQSTLNEVAFAPSIPFSLSKVRCSALFVTPVRRLRPNLGTPASRTHLRMLDDPPTQPDSTPSETSESLEAPTATTSAADILKTMREDSAKTTLASNRNMLGVYRDVDGKSNVWAVEPVEQTDTSPQLSTTVIIAIAAAFIVASLLILPLLPFSNPDQL